MKYLPLFSLILLGCPTEDTDLDIDPPTESLEIAGQYVDGFGGSHDISASTWVMDGMGTFHITQFDNDTDFLVAQNDSENAFSADLWSRIDWYDDGTTLWFCQSAYEAATESDALEAAPADSTDPANDGCGGFGWSELTAQ